ncbi:MAG: hypothetical protein ACRDID_16530 [Ktedonobacterales bacterium]
MMVGSLPINLLLSLVFGVGQVVVGAWLAAHTIGRGRGWRTGVLVCVGLWFVVSGVIELVVSGMEASQRLTGSPGRVTFDVWRGRGDLALAVVTVALAIGALLYPLLLRWWTRHTAHTVQDASVEASVEASAEGKRSA